MASISFDTLLTIYRHTSFDAEGDEGVLSIATAEVLAAIAAIETDDIAFDDADIAILGGDVGSLAVGQKVRIRIGTPRHALGQLVRNLDKLLQTPGALIAEPSAYYVIDGGIEKGVSPLPPELINYRAILSLVALFAEAASYLDRTRQELVLFREGKFVVPVRYDARTVRKFSPDVANDLLDIFAEGLHKDQKLTILGEALFHISESQPASTRLTYLLLNIEAVLEEVRNGYKLFASSFSFAKIKSELETANVEYVSKIHKTLIDIQGQLLGIPVATVLVASQLEVAPLCGVEFWTNVAVVSGAWIFVVLLIFAIANQWMTLNSIAGEVERQKRKLVDDYAAIGDQFVGTFDGLLGRICWHRLALACVGLIAVTGAAAATVAFHFLSDVSVRGCLAVHFRG